MITAVIVAVTDIILTVIWQNILIPAMAAMLTQMK